MIESSNLLPLWPRVNSPKDNTQKTEENCIVTMLKSFTSLAVSTI